MFGVWGLGGEKYHYEADIFFVFLGLIFNLWTEPEYETFVAGHLEFLLDSDL